MMDHLSAHRSALVVVPNFQLRGIAKQIKELAHELARRGIVCGVCVLGSSGPWQQELEAAGVAFDVLNCRHCLDVARRRRFRSVLAERRPSAVHVWGMEALRTVAFSGWTGRCVVTPYLGEKDFRSWLRFIDRSLLRRADRVMALGEWEASKCREWGVAPEKITVFSPGIAIRSMPAPARLAGICPDDKVILCVGRLEMHKGFQESIWAADILRYPHPNLHVVIVGDGPDKDRLRSFAESLAGPGVVHFVGAKSDVLPWMARADVVWSTGRCDTGSQVVLEAMMAGRPVIAHRRPRLMELVQEGETGHLVTPGDTVALARRGHQLLTNDELCRRMGENGRRRVETHLQIGHVADVWQRACFGAPSAKPALGDVA